MGKRRGSIHPSLPLTNVSTSLAGATEVTLVLIDSKTFRFEASHRLPKHPGKCRRLHGHSWVLTVGVAGEINLETGMVIDYADIKAAVNPLIDKLDHKHLGTWEGLNTNELIDAMVPGLPLYWNPTSENLLLWIQSQLPGLNWCYLKLNETCTSEALLIKEGFRAI